jgi:hypothetical protein
MYNFRFDANRPPVDGTLTIGLFRPGTPTSVTVTGAVPSAGTACPADFDGDGAVNLADYLAYLNLFAASDPRADMDGNGTVNIQDFLAFLQAFAAGC